MGPSREFTDSQVPALRAPDGFVHLGPAPQGCAEWHPKGLEDFPPSQALDTLSMKKAADQVMEKMENAGEGGT